MSKVFEVWVGRLLYHTPSIDTDAIDVLRDKCKEDIKLAVRALALAAKASNFKMRGIPNRCLIVAEAAVSCFEPRDFNVPQLDADIRTILVNLEGHIMYDSLLFDKFVATLGRAHGFAPQPQAPEDPVRQTAQIIPFPKGPSKR